MSEVTELPALLEQFRMASKLLKEYRDSTFPWGQKVIVDNKRYRGPGMVTGDETCPLDQVAVKLSNGNVWWYAIETCTPVAGGRG